MIPRILILSVLTLATAHAYADDDAQTRSCKAWQAQRPLPAMSIQDAMAARQYLIALCDGNPYAHLAMLPPEITRAPVASAPVTCMNLGNGMTVCQ